VAGTIAPRRTRLTLVVQRRAGRRNVRVATVAVRARAGRFRKAFRVRSPGLYRFYVRVAGDRDTLSATSAPFYIRVVPSGGGSAAD
jgi:hypothetical protein